MVAFCLWSLRLYVGASAVLDFALAFQLADALEGSRHHLAKLLLCMERHELLSLEVRILPNLKGGDES